MIKLNTPYHVAEENVTVTFTEVKNGAIIGAYPNATLTGTLEGNVLSVSSCANRVEEHRSSRFNGQSIRRSSRGIG